MQYFGVRVFIVSVLIFGLLCSTNDLERLKKRIKILEIKLNTEAYLRDEEYAEITERLDDIDKVLNVTVARDHQIISEPTEISYVEYQTVDLLKEDFVRIRMAFREEKFETERIRREIPTIENNLISINEDVENYCKGAFNNTDQLLTSFEASSVSEKQILLNVIEKLETVTNNTEDNKIINEDHLVLQDMAEKVQLNIENDRKMSKQIGNLELLVINMFSHIQVFLSSKASSCLDIKGKGIVESNIYKLHHGFEVYCDQTTDGGGWTVFQRRLDGEVDFYRNWKEYKKGFGDLNGEFWLGNEHLSLLTAEENHELRVEMQDFDGNTAYAKYSKFKIYPEEDKYKLEVSGYSGTAGDSLNYHNGKMFSTFDSDNDTWLSGNCVQKWHGAWWNGYCHHSSLNVQYYSEPGKEDYSGINWYHWKTSGYCLKKVEMKFR